jgi:hypothetical protein
MTDTPGGRRWRPRTRKIPEPARPAEPASAMRLAIGLLTASLDSPELEVWAAWAPPWDSPSQAIMARPYSRLSMPNVTR